MEQSLTEKCCNDEPNKSIITHRELFSHMVLSHIAIVIPCIWWLFGHNSGTYISHCVDKIMAVILTFPVIITTTYHYYNECVFHSIEANTLILNTLLLNVYMYYRGVPYLYIFIGFGILYVLQVTIQKVEKDKCRIKYEQYHPYIHYIAGFYVMYCVYLIQHTFTEDACTINDEYVS
jgi:hypothetical protein